MDFGSRIPKPTINPSATRHSVGWCEGNTDTPSVSGYIGAYSSSFVSTHLGQLWQGPLNGGSTQEQYLYCSSSQPHQVTGLYSTGATCSSKTGQVYGRSYDAWGNVTSRSITNGTTLLTYTLSYDGLDHLVRWNDTQTTTNEEWYLYDASGNRVLKRSATGTGTSNTKIILYPFGLQEHTYDGAGTLQFSKYYYRLGGHLVGKSDGSATSFFVTDALGSVLANFSAKVGSAALLGNQTYGPYGSAQYQKGTLGTAKGFTGQYNDALTTLDYYGSRYYDPAVGVFLSADSVSGNRTGRNPYAYVGGNPETYSDPTGLIACNESGSICHVPPPPPIGGPWNALQPFNPPSGGTTQTLVPFSPFALHHTVGTTKPSSVFQVDSLNTCAPAGLSQALCGNGYANYAVYLSTGGVIGLPGPFSLCSECGPGGGPNDNGESGGFRDLINVLASDTGGEGSGDVAEGGGGFPNNLPGDLTAELKIAEELGVTPLKVGEPGFDEVINEGTIKWVVTKDGELLVIPHTVGTQELSHTVLTGGGPVIIAGEADIAGSKGQYFLLDINAHSGHYFPAGDPAAEAAWNEALNKVGIPGFKNAGIIGGI